MAIHHVPRRSIRTNESDLFAKALAEIPSWLVVDYAHVLRYFVGSAEFGQWPIPLIADWEGYDGYVITSPVRSGATYDNTTFLGKSVKCVSLSFCTRPNVQNIRFLPDEPRSGMIWISSLTLDRLRIEYRSDNMAALRFRYSLLLEAQIQPHHTIGYPATVIPVWIGYSIKEYWTEPLEVPLMIWKLWTAGVIDDPARGIEINVSNELILQYNNSPRYPKRLFHLIRDLGENAFEKLFKFGCIDEETYRIIIARLMLLENGSTNLIGKDDIDSLRVTEASTLYTRELIGERAEVYKLSDKEIWRLTEAYKFEGRVMTTTPWMRALHYESTSGPSTFFARNEKRGLLVLKKDPSGVGISFIFTEKGKRAIGAI